MSYGKTGQPFEPPALKSLKSEIQKGLADIVAGRVQDFDAARIIVRGRTLLAARSGSE
jgi:hypothetical protein